MKYVEVVEAYAHGDAVSGAAAQVYDAAVHAHRSIDGCGLAIVCAFIADADGKYRAEVGIEGRGPRDMGDIVGDTLQKLAEVLRGALSQQAEAHDRKVSPLED